jgi:hypothetical protein
MPIPVALAALVSTLAQQGLSLIGNAVLAKGKEVVEEKLGVNLEESVKTEAGLIRLQELQIEREEVLNNFVLAQREQELKFEEMAHADRANSRDSNARIQESSEASWLAKNAGYILDFAIVSATLILIAAMLFKSIPPENKEIAFTMLGSLATLCGTVVQWHRGSSSGSARKTDAMERAMGGRS